MRKPLMMMVILLVFGISLQAQENNKKEAFKSKRGVYILPEAGDIALGFNASPFLRYAGNLMNGNTGNSLNYSFPHSNAIVGKYFLTDKTAVRGELRFGYNRDKDQNFVSQNGTDPADKVMVTDAKTLKRTEIHLGGGYEMRRGHGRVQGYYGVMAEFQYDRTNINYDYGNDIDAVYNQPASTDFGNNLSPFRTTKVSDLQKLSFGVRGFIGVEYFFAPKISLGAEFGWGPKTNVYTDGSETREFWDGTKVKTETTDVARDSEFTLDTYTRGQIVLLFHF